MKNLQKLALLTLLFPTFASAADYTIDPEHSKIGFKVKHLGISSVVGHFGSFTGNFIYDPQNVASSKAQASITAKSINTDQTKRDDHLRSPDFLNVEKSPEITFVSKEIKPLNEGTFQVIGDLTINGITKSVVLDTEYGGSANDPWGNERAAFSASTTLNRKDFGIVWNKVLETGGLVVGEDVKISLEIEGIKKKSS